LTCLRRYFTFNSFVATGHDKHENLHYFNGL
jgi:hypothetical protein